MNTPYRHTQFGTLMLAIFGPMFLLSLVWTLASDFAWPAVLGSGLMAACLVTFLSLTVEVDTQKIQISLGPGIVRKAFPLSQVANVRVVKNSPTDGLGLHWSAAGWVYAISGLEAVELEMRQGANIRIGTDEPAALAKAIEDALITHKDTIVRKPLDS